MNEHFDPKAPRERKTVRFTESFVRRAAPGFYCDALTPTLNLLVTDTGSRRWVQRIRVNGKQRRLGLGGWPVVTLQEARDLALDNRRSVRRGLGTQSRSTPISAVPFRMAVQSVIDLNRESWKGSRTEANMRNALERHAGDLYDKAIDAITVDDVLEVMRPVWGAKPALAAKLRQHLLTVFDWAIAKGYRENNPAKAALSVLPKNGNGHKHFDAAPYADVPALVAAIRETKAPLAAKLGFEFMILTAARGIEARGAKWDEIEGDTWVVPAERMKAGREHRVPLSARALAILEEAKALRDSSNAIFPSPRRSKDGHLSHSAFNRALEATGDKHTPHGFRSSFRDWCAETSTPREIAEAALAHVVPGVEGAYYRTKHFEQRRELMALWASYIAEREVK